MLVIKNLSVSVGQKQIIKDFHLSIKPQQIHAIMGPNGSGKSTLAYALAGHPHYTISKSSQITLDRQPLTQLSPDQRAQLGLFLAFQYPSSISGVSVQNFLKTANDSIHPPQKPQPVIKFRNKLQSLARTLSIDPQLLRRSLNEGFSGGEKKRIEILQLLTLKPKYAILDETDSGLDIDSIKIVAQGIKKAVTTSHTGCIIITHYQRILNYLQPDRVHIMVNGRIIKSGNASLVRLLEDKGYQHFTQTINQ